MADQLDLVKNLPLTPDFIINIKVNTESTYLYLIISKNIYVFEQNCLFVLVTVRLFTLHWLFASIGSTD